MARAILLVLALAGVAGAAEPVPSERRICELINEKRAEMNVPPLSLSTALYDAAKFHSDDLAAHGGNCDLHNSCNGELWSKRITRFYPAWIALGENVATSISDPVQIVDGWMTSGGHRANILSRSFTEVGCALTMGQTGFGQLAFATADFGSRGMVPVTPGGPTASPRPTPTGSPFPVSIDSIRVSGSAVRTMFSVRVSIPPTASLSAPVALEVDGVVVAAISGECVQLRGRGARSACPGPRLTLTPAGAPRYRVRLQFDGSFVPATEYRLTLAGQTWTVRRP